MRILLLVSSMHGGGAERVAALLTNAWCAQGDEVTLLPTFSGRGTCAYPLHPKARLVFLADLAPGASRIGRLQALRRYIRTERPDVVISMMVQINLISLLVTRGLDVPVLVSERTYPPAHDPPISRGEALLRRITYRLAHRVVVQTEVVGDWVRAHCPGSRTIVIPNPVSFPMPVSEPVIDPATTLGGAPFVIAAGRLIPSKRFDVLLRAFAPAVKNARAPWRLVILGDGPERDALLRLAADLEIRDRLVLPGFVGNPGAWYAAASVYVLTSSYEGFPNTLLEAMAHGVPSVSFDVRCGPRDILRGGDTGVLLPDDDHVRRLTVALESLLTDEPARARLAERALTARSSYALDTIVGAWNELLSEAVSARRARGVTPSSRASAC